MLIATRSALLPPNTSTQMADDEMDLVLPLGTSFEEKDARPVDWELWGEESTIEVCELSIETNGVVVGWCFRILTWLSPNSLLTRNHDEASPIRP